MNWTTTLFLVGQLAMVSIVEARSGPSVPVEVSEQDREAMVLALGVESERVLEIQAWAWTASDVPLAYVTVFEERVNDRLSVVSQRVCSPKPPRWECSEMALPRRFYHAQWPRSCFKRASDPPERISIMLNTKLAPEEIERLLDTLCESDVIQHLQALGYTFHSISNNHDPLVEGLSLRTTSPDSLDYGAAVEVRKLWSKGVCRFEVGDILYWMT